MARTGSGYWFQGRMVRSVDNIAASVNQGYAYLSSRHPHAQLPRHRLHAAGGTCARRQFQSRRPAHPEFSPERELLPARSVCTLSRPTPNQQHDIHSHLSRFTAWEVRAGAALEYTSHYLLEDFDIIGKTPEPFSSALFGYRLWQQHQRHGDQQKHILLTWPSAFRWARDLPTRACHPEANQYVVIDATFDNVDE